MIWNKNIGRELIFVFMFAGEKKIGNLESKVGLKVV